MNTFFLTLYISLLTLFTSDCDTIKMVRQEYLKIKTEEHLVQFLENFENNTCKSIQPYVISVQIQRAKYTSWPHKKIKYFNSGKKELEQYITDNPTDIEARFVRILVQKNTPSFLGYDTNIQSDTNFIKKHISDAQLSESYKKTILTLIENTPQVY